MANKPEKDILLSKRERLNRPPNMLCLRPGMYIVRSGAGYRTALAHFGIAPRDIGAVIGCPQSFPSLLTLTSIVEDDQIKVICQPVHLNKLYAALEEIDGQTFQGKFPSKGLLEAIADEKKHPTK